MPDRRVSNPRDRSLGTPLSIIIATRERALLASWGMLLFASLQIAMMEAILFSAVA